MSANRIFRQLVVDPLILISWIILLTVTIIVALLHFEGRRRLREAAAHPPVITAPASPPIAQTAPVTKTRRSSRSRSRQPKPAPAITIPPAPAARPEPILTNAQIWGRSALTGYAFWALFWGLPPCLKLVGKLGWGALSGYFVIGCLASAAIAAVLLVLGVYYSVFGGGAVHFGVRWWRLCHVRTPAGEAESQLRDVEDLYRRGVITPDEYGVRREEILRRL